MGNTLTHFAIYADDLNRAEKFYQKIFSWGFQSYGTEDFKQIKVSDAEKAPLIGAIQHRKYSPLKEKIIGLEGTIQVKDISQVEQAVKEGGGTLLMPKTAIPHVGWIIKFLDTEGNLLCAMQADAAAL
ncbi:MAG: hypothetical protein RLP14_04100 [Owenweeksia sp.]